MPGRLYLGRNRWGTRSRTAPVGRPKTDRPCMARMLFRHCLPARIQEDTSHTHLNLHLLHSNPLGRRCKRLLPQDASRTAREDTRHRASAWRARSRCGPAHNRHSPRCQSRLAVARTFPFRNSDSSKATLRPQRCSHACRAHMACRHPNQSPHTRRSSARPGMGCRRTPYLPKSTRQGTTHSSPNDPPR